MAANYEEALRFIINYLRDPQYRRLVDFSNYGYDLYLPNVMRAYIVMTEKVDYHEADRSLHRNDISPLFYNAAWELCRRGILRPGVRTVREQSTEQGSAGNGYSVTLFGTQWLSEGAHDDFVATEPERFGRMISPFRDRFGEAFYQRSQEAIRCYGAHAYLACCILCGAATESIVLSIAFQLRHEAEVLAMYNSSRGRSRVETLILGQARDRLRQEFEGYLTLLKYWRDIAAHGQATIIADDEAYTSLAMLLRFAHYVNDWWDELTAKS
ncbi:MAG: hypothetical protein ACYDCO_07540 [Armatimonadota bacterium]